MDSDEENTICDAFTLVCTTVVVHNLKTKSKEGSGIYLLIEVEIRKYFS